MLLISINFTPKTSQNQLPNKMALSYPICSMYGIFAYIWLKFMVKVGNIPYMEHYMKPMGMFSRSGLFSIASFGSLNRWDR